MDPTRRKVVEALEKALVSPAHAQTLAPVKAAELEETLFLTYNQADKTYTSKARALMTRIKQNPLFKTHVLENHINIKDKYALGFEKLPEPPAYISLIKQQQNKEHVQEIPDPDVPPLTLILVSFEDALHRAWQIHFNGVPNVQFHQGDILKVKCDAVVSPANCFGYMDGGIDQAYMNHFGDSIQTSVQSIISTYHNGIMKIGNAEVVTTNNKDIPFLIATPTMLTPDALHSSTINPYLAARAMLSLWKSGTFRAILPYDIRGKPVSSRIQTIAIPGMGTGIGRVPPNTCAHQVRIAYDEVMQHQML